VTLRLSISEYRTAARSLLELAVNGAAGRNEDDPFYQRVTEGRDVGAMRSKYSSCGDLAHWLLYRLGVRCSFVNRKEHRGWTSGVNVSSLAFSPAATTPADRTFGAGDILIVWNQAKGTDAHVLVAIEHTGDSLTSADYGQPGGALKRRMLSRRAGRLYLGERQIQRVLALETVLAVADARRELMAPDLSLLTGEPAPAPYPFVQARNYTKAGRKHVDLVVLHTMEATEKPNTAESVAAWFAGTSTPKASAHYCVDSDSVVQCVRDEDVAWHAPGANHNGIGIEHAGYAKQTADDWGDEYSMRMLRLSAKLCAEVCRKWQIPVRRVVQTEVKTGVRGICGHADVSKAFGKSTHWDPGPSFPWETYLTLVESYFTGEALDALDEEKTDPETPAARSVTNPDGAPRS
jgi:N-acetyl-anhydromuramyl-L-alanine amidase AmpD